MSPSSKVTNSPWQVVLSFMDRSVHEKNFPLNSCTPMTPNMNMRSTVTAMIFPPLAGCVVVHGQVGAGKNLRLEQLHPDDSKHEYEEHCHSHDISNRLH